MSNFDTCYPSVIKEEGGFVNDPQDAGGMTNLGVTKEAWEHWLGRKATEAEMRGLTPAGVKAFYQAMYWNVAQCDRFPISLALCLFHAAVNCGPGRATKLLQGMVGAGPDGALGPASLAAYAMWARGRDRPAIVHAYQEQLRAYYRTRPTFPRFGRGWLNRCDEVEKQARGMIQ